MKRLILSFLLVPFALTACGHNVKKSLGLERNAPDEFAVMNRAPLTMPPNFNLMPPTPGAKSPQEALAANDAQDLVLGDQAASTNPGNSAGQAALLSQAGANKNNAAVRQELAKPQTSTTEKSSVVQKLGLVGSGQSNDELDATDEAARLQKDNINTPPVSPVMKNAQ